LVGVNPVVGVIGVFWVAEIVCVPGVIAAAAGSETVTLIVEVAVTAPAVAVIVKTVVANVTVGVPVITPVVEFMDNPLGSGAEIV
jgi:hypothetical protein